MSTKLFQEQKTQYLEEECVECFEKFKLKVCINRVGSMLSFHFNSVSCLFDDACAADANYFKGIPWHVKTRCVFGAFSFRNTLYFPITHKIT